MTDSSDKPSNVSTRFLDRQRDQNELAFSIMLSNLWEGMAVRHNEHQAAETLRFKPFLQQLDAQLHGYEAPGVHNVEAVVRDALTVLSYATRCKGMFTKHAMDTAEGAAKRGETYKSLCALQVRAVQLLAFYTATTESYTPKKVQRIVHTEPVRSILSTDERREVMHALFPVESKVTSLKRT